METLLQDIRFARAASGGRGQLALRRVFQSAHAATPVAAVGARGRAHEHAADSKLGVNGYFNVVGRPEESNPARKPFGEFRVVSSDYFRALSIPVVAGRGFTEQDTRGTPPVLLINEEFATRYFPNENPIGKQIKPWTDTPATIVGVVAAVRQRSLDRPASSEIYISAGQAGPGWVGSMTVVVSTSIRGQLLMLVLRASVLGLVAGLAAALALTKVLGAMLYEIGPRDPVSFVVATLAVATTALVATMIPAMRAAKVDPIVAIRAEQGISWLGDISEDGPPAERFVSFA